MPSSVRRRLTGAQLARRWRHGVLRGTLRRLPALQPWLDAGEAAASPEGRAVLQAGRALITEERRVFQGSCWSFAAEVYRSAGMRRRNRFKSKRTGPYATPADFKPGDLLSYINHSYGGSLHSAIFVTWLDELKREALMMTYVGGNRRRTGDYRSYRLTHVYRALRPER